MIRFLLNTYIVVLIIDSILSYFPQFDLMPARVVISKISEVTLKPIRKLLPDDIGFDFSPLIVIFAILLIEALW